MVVESLNLNMMVFFLEILESLGEMPLPPYIKERLDDPDRYQTVYAEENGSAAAPTAGLHFTKELLEEIKAKGVHLVYLTLHVGLGTFRPVSVDNIEEHHMHSEFYRLTEEAAKQLNEVRQAGGRIVRLEQLLFVRWKQLAQNLMVKFRLTVAGPIFLSHQGINLKS